MLRGLAGVVVAACGRLEFDPHTDAGLDPVGMCRPWEGSWTAEVPTVFLETTGYTHAPSFSVDCLHLYYSRGGDIRQVTRTALDQPFGAEAFVADLSDGVVNDLNVGIVPPFALEAFVARLDSGIWRATRTDTSAQFTVIESTGLSGIDVAVSGDGLRVYFESAMFPQDIYMAERAGIGQPFGAPVPVPELATAAREHGVYMMPNELFAIVGTGPVSELDLWMFARTDRTASFNAPVRLDALSQAGVAEAHAALCPATCELFYISEGASPDTRLMRTKLVPR